MNLALCGNCMYLAMSSSLWMCLETMSFLRFFMASFASSDTSRKASGKNSNMSSLVSGTIRYTKQGYFDTLHSA